MRVATDIGGTFTDLVYITDDNKIKYGKTSTTGPNFEEGVINVIEKCKVPFEEIEHFVHGTTVIINAITEKKGVKTGLITTKGFRDVLEIGRGNRPHLFNILYKKPKPFVDRHLRMEVNERMNYKGEVVQPLNLKDLEEAVLYLKKEKVEAIAIVFLHGYKNCEHEKKAVSYIKEVWPEVYVSASHEITRQWREYERSNTTVINSYVQPIAVKYISKLEQQLTKKKMDSVKYIMQSNGGVTTFNQAKIAPLKILESGPVAGIYGSLVLGELLGEKNIIALDVGGTTAKCSLIENGEMKICTDYSIESNKDYAGYPIKIPVVDIVEIGNGGGSIAWVDDAGALKVGPISAGSNPGPIAYNKGGLEPTTTDACLLTGRLSQKNFDFDVNMELVEKIIDEKIGKPFNVSPQEAGLGIISVANSNMLNALKLISVRKGYDPLDFTLIAYGGGGSMHACELGKELGVKKVIIPTASSVFSAWGMAMSDLRKDYIYTYLKRVNNIDFKEIYNLWQNIIENAIQEFALENMPKEKIKLEGYLSMRYAGQEHSVNVPVVLKLWNEEDMIQITNDFDNLHKKQYTFNMLDVPREIVGLHLSAVGVINKPQLEKIENINSENNGLIEQREVYFENKGFVTTSVYSRNLFPIEFSVKGPVIIEEKSAVTVVEEGQSVKKDCYGNLVISL